MKIDIDVFHLPGSVISNVKKCYIEMLPDRFIYCHDFDVDIPADPEEEEYENEEFRITEKATYKKSSIVGAALSSKRIYDAENNSYLDVYSVSIPVANVDDMIEVTFETLKKANDFHIKLVNYIFQ